MRLSALIASILLLTCLEVHASDKIDRRLLELTVGDTKYQGRQLVSDQEVCWMLERTGRLRNIELDQVTEFKQIGNVYRPFSTNEMRTQLLTEFGRKFEAEARGSHVVVAPTGKAKACADIVEATARSFTSYFNRRNFKLDKIEAPIVTIVFPTQADFVAYCEKEQLTRTKGLRGYYSPTTNRVALYLDHHATAAKSVTADMTQPLTDFTQLRGPTAPLMLQTHFGSPQSASNFRDTLTHETTHQMGFNCGLHCRLGDDPTWVVEGMAMLFEGDSNRDDTQTKTTVIQRMNRERFVWFQEYCQSRRQPKSLEEFLTTDAMFTSATLDAYSEAWALTFFLAETRPSNLSGYLKKLANRSDLGEYTPMKRLNDFKASFGRDLQQLEMQYLRFIREIELPTPVEASTDPLKSFKVPPVNLP